MKFWSALMVTLKDIAGRAGVSSPTVSAVLSRRGNTRVSARTRRRVETLAHEMGYQANLAARALVKRKTYTIGILFPHLHERCYSDIVHGLQLELQQHQYVCSAATWEDNEGFVAARDVVLSRGVDGVICCHDTFDDFPANLPVVAYAYDGIQPTGRDFVAADRACLIRHGMAYLTGLGHRRIGYIGSFKDSRYGDFLAVSAEMGLPIESAWHFHTVGIFEGGRLGAANILAQSMRPTAVIAHNDSVAIGAISEFHANGIRVPSDISVLGVDNILEARYSSPRLTTFDYHFTEVAGDLTRAMMARLRDPSQPYTGIFKRANLIVRDSCAPPLDGASR